MDQRFLKRLLSALRCVSCGRRYEPGNIRFLSHQRELWFLSVYCPYCQNKGMLAAVVGQGDFHEVITDLTEEELARLEGKSPIGADEVLDMHLFLEEFDGDFASLFSASGKKPQRESG